MNDIETKLSDREVLQAIFERAGIAYSFSKNFLTVSAGTNGVQGYSGFTADFEFNKDGELAGMGVWE